MPVSLVLLLIVFGALIAAGIPLLLAGTAVISAISLLAIPSRWCRSTAPPRRSCCWSGWRSASTTRCSTCAGSARNARRAASTKEALRIAAHTSGRAIVVSGLTVMIALAGLFLTGIDVFSGVAIGTILVVGVAVLGSLTFLPAMLSLLGKWTDRGRIPFLGRRRTAARASKFWGLLVRAVVRHPLAWAAWPRWRCWRWPRRCSRCTWRTRASTRSAERAGGAHPGGHRAGLPRRPGASRGGRDRRQPRAASRSAAPSPPCTRRSRRPTARSGSRSRPRCSAHDQVLVISVPLAGNGTNATSNNALNTLRDQALPATLGKVPGISYAVGGDTAGNARLRRAAGEDRSPLVFAFVLGLAFLLLMAASVRSYPGPVHRPQPALGRRRLRPDGPDLPGRPPGRGCSASPPTAGSRRGCRCSCSCCCSG